MKIPPSKPWLSTDRTLGSGGQGSVQVVVSRDYQDGREYALKALSNQTSPQARARFRREIEVVRNLDHPSIVPIVDCSEPDDEFQYYVMEYYENARPLHKVISPGTSNPYHGNVLKSLDLFEQIVSAIGACEAANPQIVHRDIKPGNILVLPDESVRLIDFGICQIDDGTILTLVDENVGPRDYISPECESGNDSEIGAHSDLYSAAKVLWSAITSRKAFPREEAVHTNLSMEMVFPRQLETWHLADIFEKTIRVRPSDRIGDTNGILAIVDEVRYLIKGGFPPLKDVAERCPSCGRKTLGAFSGGHSVFGNPNPRGVRSLICKTCGFGFVRNIQMLQENLQRLKQLS